MGGEIVTGVLVLLAIIIIGGLAWIGLNQMSIENDLRAMHIANNSRMDQLLKATMELAYGRGVADEKQRHVP